MTLPRVTRVEKTQAFFGVIILSIAMLSVLGVAPSAHAAGVPTAISLLSYPDPSLDGMVVTFTAVVQTLYNPSLPPPTGQIGFSTDYYEETLFQGLQGPYQVALGGSIVESSTAQITDLTGGLPLPPVVSSTAQFTTVPGSLPFPYSLPFYSWTGTITACYSGDAVYASSCAAVDPRVTGSDTTLTLTSSRNPSLVGDRPQFSALVTARVGIPSGTVKFADATTGAMLGSEPLDASGHAGLPPTLLGLGVHLIQATYVPPAGLAGLYYHYSSSTSTLVQLVVGWLP